MFTYFPDEYTKITTPRQDVLFKKGYLTRRKVVPETVSENSVDQTSDGELYFLINQFFPSYNYSYSIEVFFFRSF